jgi:hypothetical protein
VQLRSSVVGEAISEFQVLKGDRTVKSIVLMSLQQRREELEHRIG